jgi:hypothetical protein
MAKLPPERLAKALRANLKRRKQQPSAPVPTGSAKDPEKLKEKRPVTVPPPPAQTPGR